MGGLKCSRLKYKLLFRAGVCASRLNSRDQWKSGLKMEIRMLYYYFFECTLKDTLTGKTSGFLS